MLLLRLMWTTDAEVAVLTVGLIDRISYYFGINVCVFCEYAYCDKSIFYKIILLVYLLY
ncbi:hypothetical protein J2X31_000983 [Flavobacterium arsenatis]|uniref:Uncharacterized protein n=1 Tax=Flavobacterium arsenatis TaxID=1484332 RepID=A0ABU1TNH5_9FLAO|nr:hypothetical protein [Flavobacterium arsenatis]MDR6966983.1 hypothetical protein [Flavobacterium arsenatis]